MIIYYNIVFAKEPHPKDLDNNKNELSYRIFEKKWKKVYLFWLGRDDIDSPQKEKLLESLTKLEFGLEPTIDFYRIQAYLLTFMGLDEFKECSTTLKQKINYYLISVLKSNTSSIKKKTIQLLGKTSNNKIIESLIEILNENTDSDMRIFLLEALGNIGSNRVIEPVITCLVDECELVRHSVLLTLEQIIGKSHMKSLRMALENGNYTVAKEFILNNFEKEQ